MVVFVLTREVFTQADSAALKADDMVATLVDVYLRGMTPDPDGPTQSTADKPKKGTTPRSG
jgi:hypothetical protein